MWEGRNALLATGEGAGCGAMCAPTFRAAPKRSALTHLPAGHAGADRGRRGFATDGCIAASCLGQLPLGPVDEVDRFAGLPLSEEARDVVVRGFGLRFFDHRLDALDGAGCDAGAASPALGLFQTRQGGGGGFVIRDHFGESGADLLRGSAEEAGPVRARPARRGRLEPAQQAVPDGWCAVPLRRQPDDLFPKLLPQVPDGPPTLSLCPSLTRSNRRGTDPYARWWGRGGTARCPPIPINRWPTSPGIRRHLHAMSLIQCNRAGQSCLSLPPRYIARATGNRRTAARRSRMPLASG